MNVTPRVFFNNKNQYVHVYPSGDTYFKDRFTTRTMRMYGSEAAAIKAVKNLGYLAERVV